jgi:hypothetical protein
LPRVARFGVQALLHAHENGPIQCGLQKHTNPLQQLVGGGFWLAEGQQLQQPSPVPGTFSQQPYMIRAVGKLTTNNSAPGIATKSCSGFASLSAAARHSWNLICSRRGTPQT